MSSPVDELDAEIAAARAGAAELGAIEEAAERLARAHARKARWLRERGGDEARTLEALAQRRRDRLALIPRIEAAEVARRELAALRAELEARATQSSPALAALVGELTGIPVVPATAPDTTPLDEALTRLYAACAGAGVPCDERTLEATLVQRRREIDAELEGLAARRVQLIETAR